MPEVGSRAAALTVGAPLAGSFGALAAAGLSQRWDTVN
jgi:hypothetical protein